ncbi:hypothetical protein LINPERHAP1_LOCUS4939, partial [Linum perenne]
GKMTKSGNGPIHFRKEDIAEVDDRTEYFLLVRIFWDHPKPLEYVQEALDKLWKCQALGYVRDVKLYSAEVEGFCLKGFVTLDILAPRLGREKVIMNGCREFWVYFQYEKVQAICFRCRLIGHVLKRCPNLELPLDLEARNDWICVEESGEVIDDTFLLKKSEEKRWAKKSRTKLPQAVLKASSTLILRGHERSDNRGGAGEWRGNRQSSLLARSTVKTVHPHKTLSSNKGSTQSHGRTVSNAFHRLDNRNTEAETQPPSKKRLTYEEKGKGKMHSKDKQKLMANPRTAGGITIREPSDNLRFNDKQRGTDGGDTI